MSWWLLMMVGLSVIDLKITYGNYEINLSSIFRIITFICCCIWG